MRCQTGKLFRTYSYAKRARFFFVPMLLRGNAAAALEFIYVTGDHIGYSPKILFMKR